MKFVDPQEMYDYLFGSKCAGNDTVAFAELTAHLWGVSARVRDIAIDGPGDHLIDESFLWKEGQTVRVVMVSRLGDFGITDDLDAMFGYKVRLPLDTPLLTNCRTEL